MKIFPKILLIFILLLIASCTKSNNPVENELGTTPGYPGVVNVDPTRTPIVIPTANSTTGVVTGKILSVTDDEPLAYTTIYLGEKLFLSDSEEYLITLQEKSSPHAETDQNGFFAISDVLPGEYVIILFSPLKSTTIMDPVSGKELFIQVEANKITTLPSYNVSWP